MSTRSAYERVARRLRGEVGKAMPDDDKPKFPDTFTINSSNLLIFALKGQSNIPQREWQEVAEYKLVRIRRVRYMEQWED